MPVELATADQPNLLAWLARRLSTLTDNQHYVSFRRLGAFGTLLRKPDIESLRLLVCLRWQHHR